MRIKPPELPISKEIPFDHDRLNRKESAEVLSQLIKSFSEPIVLAVDSPWGTGKTTFVRMWKQQLVNDKVPCLYFNAWENDFSEDPLVSLIGETEIMIESLSLDNNRKIKAKKYFSKAKTFSFALLKGALPTAVKIATAGVLNINDLTDDALAQLAETVAKEQINKYESDKLTISKFKKELTSFVKEISDGVSGKTETPLVFFIDELDRCRPDYAVQLLEKAKHLFNIQGIVFVLSIDKEQIGHSIRSIYGTGMDVDGYLRRFIDIDYRLPEPDRQAFCGALMDRFAISDYLQTRKQISRDASGDKGHLQLVLSNLSDIFQLSLRQQEYCFSQLSLVLRTVPPTVKIFPDFLATLIALKTKNLNLYNDYIKHNAKKDDVLEYIKQFSGGEAFLRSSSGLVVEGFLARERGNEEEIRQYISKYESIATNKELPQKQQDWARCLIGVIEEVIKETLDLDARAYLAKKIEIADRFE